MSCGNNKALDDLKAKQAELDGLLAGGKDQLAAMQSKLTAMKADLDTFKPTLPAVESLQDKINELAGTTNPIDVTSKIAELKAKFGAAVPELDSILGNLGLDETSLVAKLGLPAGTTSDSLITSAKSDICALVPNMELKDDGTVKEEPSEPKVPEEPPVAPELTAVIVKDIEELNTKLLSQSMRNSRKSIQSSTKFAFSRFISKKKNKLFYDSTFEEVFVEVIEAAGEDYNTYKSHSRTKEELRLAQKILSSKYPDATWDFIKEGQICQKTYNLVKANNSKFSQASDFTTSCNQYLVRRKASLATKEV
tara:strand:+ start:390 stop:1313 length:924 start_codon:yes stop_codon:yes gene_type:complete